MDGGNQNSGKPEEKKSQLSWSQPITTPLQNQSVSKQNEQKKEGSKMGSTPATKSNVVRNTIITLIVLAAIGGIWSVVTSNKKSSDMSAGSVATSTANGSSTSQTMSGTSVSLADGSLTMPSPQTAGLEVSVSHVDVSVPTWVVVYENYNGQPGNVLGAGLFVPGRTSGVVDLLRGTLPGQTYFAGLSRDDGDHMYAIANDPAVRDANGNPVSLKFQTK